MYVTFEHFIKAEGEMLADEKKIISTLVLGLKENGHKLLCRMFLFARAFLRLETGYNKKERKANKVRKIL